MAAMMTARRSYNLPPTLPPRDQPTSNATGSAYGQGRRESLDMPPPVPPMSFHRRASESAIKHSQPITVRVDSNPPLPVRTTSKTSSGGNASSPHGTSEAPPPLPSRDNDMSKSQPIRRQSFETNSFVTRHTARAYSVTGGDTRSRDYSHHDGREGMPLPPLPSTDHQAPRRKMSAPTMNDVFEVTENPTPAPPPSKPPRGRPTGSQGSSSEEVTQNPTPAPPSSMPPRGRQTGSLGSSGEDFEKRFFFHGTLDFPVPEPCTLTNKTYPSVTREYSKRANSKGTSNQRTLGCL